MRFDVVTLFPQMIVEASRYGVTGRALERGQAELVTWNPRDFTRDRHRTVDDRPYGGGPGMVMKAEPLRAAIRAAREADARPARVVYLSPQGRKLDQAAVETFSRRARMILVAGRYEGVDERLVESEIDEEWSIGDYVLSGGELAALVVIDAVTRLLPGVLHHEESARQDSHVAGLLDHPHYTRPEEIDGRRVPQVLLSGDHQAIARWRLKQALGRTWLRRPDLLARLELDETRRQLLEEFKTEMTTQGDDDEQHH
ncbi:tRNA (guanine37-N1)-methyltransferase [Methylomarinovum caldicuralii]|uniref:tRNA (guanine-N(1)-)-methyltransferase n=1 Tax=Methylomarinovum caldicuralii TaxID=438856 RepID=A0AAU9C5D1_9GAMM|nr:tRNA (guanosine(37)-N1)-methyltransferase TrmD [Methylomarinovum caldicuralii]BCX82314.1 tRNA (guanine37-N1)-methyltransferase [Methylomarinovum caldicuralii]